MTAQPIAKLCWQTEAGEAGYRLKPAETVTIGRGPDNTIVLDDSMVSRHHACIAWDGEGFTVQDMGSRNGTLVNGQRVQGAQQLADGDEIVLHKRRLTFEMLEVVEEIEPQPGETIVAEPLSGQPRLIVSAGPDAGREILLSSDIVTIGRVSKSANWPDAQVLLTDRAISRPHACVQRDASGFNIVDLESANGTTVNGQRISEPHSLADGDVIGLGETRLVFRAGS
jgi:pSer/pThr/pTyr-binding forkhead associated (FHA) protein